MAGRLAEVRVIDPILTRIARGYRNASLVGQAIFPRVNVPKETGKYLIFDKSAFVVYNTKRAIRGDSNIMPSGAVTSQLYGLVEHDLAAPQDNREVREAQFDLDARNLNDVQKVMELEKEIEIASIALNAASYASGNKVTLVTTGQWSNHGTTTPSDPIGNIITGKSAIRASIGMKPNTLLLGAKSYEALQDHPQIVERIKYSAAGVVTIDLLKELFDIQNIVVGDAVTAASMTAAFTDVWGDYALLAWVPETEEEQRSTDAPGFGYTLTLEGYPQIDRYFGVGGKVEYIRNTDIYKPVLVGADAGYLISDTVA